jgi:DNA-binding MarR family transcriptional regulator
MSKPTLKRLLATPSLPEISAEQQALKLGFAINDTARLRRQIFDAALRPAGFTTAQASIMRHLSQKDGLSQSELAQQLELGKVAVGECVERLVSAGFVEKRANDVDRRMWNLYLTAEGWQAVTKLRGLALGLNTRIMAGVSPAEVRESLRVLEILKRNLLELTRN